MNVWVCPWNPEKVYLLRNFHRVIVVNITFGVIDKAHFQIFKMHRWVGFYALGKAKPIVSWGLPDKIKDTLKKQYLF